MSATVTRQTAALRALVYELVTARPHRTRVLVDFFGKRREVWQTLEAWSRRGAIRYNRMTGCWESTNRRTGRWRQ